MSFRKFCLASALPCSILLAAGAASAASEDVIDSIRAPAGAALFPLADATPMRVTLSLPLRDAEGAKRLADAVSDPSSKLYGHYLTAKEYGERFGADHAAYDAVRAWAVANGLTVGKPTSSRTTVALGGTAGKFAALFGTRLAGFHNALHGDGRVMLTPAHLPDALAGKIDGVIGLSAAAKVAPLFRLKPSDRAVADVGTGNGGYGPTDLTTAYDVPAQTSSSKTETVAIFEQGGFPQSDITTYEKFYKLPTVTVTPVSVNGSGTGLNGEVTVEADLDIQAIIGMNPSVAKILVYIDSQDSFQTALVDAINQVAEDNTASIFSISYGQDEKQQGKSAIKAENTALMQLQTQGITVFVSSGDDGAVGREGSTLHAPDPGSQPLVTSVGGTRLTTNASTQAYVSEVVWNDLSQGDGATGGGVSSIWKIPAWQKVGGTSVAVANGGSAKKRNVPDIAADASPFTPYSVYCKSFGGYIGVGGTSLSAPLWAGWTSVINADRVANGLPRVGFFNPRLYSLGEAGTNFHDVTSGNNGTPGYKAGTGYDNATGFGSIDVGKLLSSLLTQ